MIVFFLNVKTFNDFSGQNLQFVQIIIFMESPHNILKPDCVCATKWESPIGRKVPAGFPVSSENNLFGKSYAVFTQSITPMK